MHGEGALFLPNTLNLSYDSIFYFKKAIKAKDFIIKNLKTVYVKNTKKFSPLDNKLYEKYNKLLSISLNEYQLEQDFRKKSI